MAFIPDEAIDRMYGELSSGARDLYTFLCRCRNQTTGRCYPSVSTTQDSLKLSRARVFALRKELATKGWAEFDGNSAIRLFGFDSLKNKTIHELTKEDSAKSLENETESLENETEAPLSLENKTKSLKNETESLENETKKSQKQDSHIRKNQQIEPANINQQIEPDMSGATAPAVREVFTYWQTRLNHPLAKLTPKRKRYIQARLKEKYTVEQLKSAIDGCRASPWHMGQNPNGTIWDDLTLICRDGEHVEMFMRKVGNGNGKPQTGKTANDANQKTTEDHGIRDCQVIGN